jgi:hypothetical protein
MDLQHRHIGGEPQKLITEALGLEIDACLQAVVDEIERLKMAAAEGPQKGKKKEKMKVPVQLLGAEEMK